MHRKTERKEEKRGYTNVNVENPNVGKKTTSSPQTAEYTVREEYIDREHRGNDLLHPFFATRWLQWRQRPLSLTHTHSLYIYSALYNIIHYTPLKVFPKSYLYTYDFQSIYTYGPQGAH